MHRKKISDKNKQIIIIGVTRKSEVMDQGGRVDQTDQLWTKTTSKRNEIAKIWKWNIFQLDKVSYSNELIV